MTEIKPLFSFFNKSLILKNKVFISLIIIAGLFDLFTSIIGTSLFKLTEINIINNFYYLGILIYIIIFIFVLLFIDIAILQNSKVLTDSKKEKRRLFSLKIFKFYKYVIVSILFIIPINNLIVILGVI